MLVTGQVIVDSAIDLADMKNSKFIDQSGTAGTELVRYLNMAYKDLYNQLVMSNEKYFISSTNISLVGGTDTYALPSDFYKLLGVDLMIENNGNRFLTLEPFMFKERNKYRNGVFFPISPLGYTLRYIISGNNLKFVPLPANSNTIQVWYVPSPTLITSLSTSLETLVGGDEYMSLYIAILMLSKEESDSSVLQAKLQMVLQQILNISRQRDQGSPSYIIDEDAINAGALFPWSRLS